MCPPSVSSSTVVVSDAASCMMAAASSSCASAGPSEPTAPTQAQHVARCIQALPSFLFFYFGANFRTCSLKNKQRFFV